MGLWVDGCDYVEAEPDPERPRIQTLICERCMKRSVGHYA